MWWNSVKIGFCVLLSVFSLVGSAQVVELDLQTCRRMALENSKKVQSAEQQYLKAGYNKKSYRANFLPKLSGMGLYTYVQKKMNFDIEGGYLPVYDQADIGQKVPINSIVFENNVPKIGSDGLPIFKQYAYMPDIHLGLGIENAYHFGLLLEQPLYMGGKVRSAYRMASIGQEMAQLNRRYSQSEVLMEADEAYWQYLKVKELGRSAEKYRDVVAELERNLEDACQTGMASQNDLLKVQVKQNEAELMLQKARNGLALAGMNLCRVIGVDLYSSLAVNDTLIPDVITPGLLDTKGDVAARPEYNILEKQVELKQKQVALTRSDFLPQLGAMATYGYGDGITLNGESEGVATFAVMASLKVPIYNWGEGRNKIRAMKAEEEISRLKKEETAQMMQLEIAQARYNVEDAVTRVRLTRKSLTQAEENLKVSKNRYEVGMETLTDYMEAQAQWQKAWSDWVDAKAGLKLSETHYLKATGRLAD